ncbi:unnamed protein product [Mytilus coruscus]|uniref:LRP2 n=1 Tax=Mytilus coruscus TaxID=42192 RepID=A0A6J8A0A8_MYTCO|nr:unnamed protein product [Mytilus coruscus]
MKRYNSLSLLLYILAVESCNDDQFQCTNGQCVSLTVICDNSFECGDRSDEVNCTITTPCPEGLVKCTAGNCAPKYSDCYTPQSEVQLSSRNIQTYFTTAERASQDKLLLNIKPTSSDNLMHSYTLSKEMQISSTIDNIILTYTKSTASDIIEETISTSLIQINDTTVNGVATIHSTKILKPFSKETPSTIMFLNSTASEFNMPSSSSQMKTSYSQSIFKFEREKSVNYNTWLQSSMQTTSRSYIMGLSYDLSHFHSSMDDKTESFKQFELSYSALYLVYSSLNVKRSKNPMTTLLSVKTKTSHRFFQNVYTHHTAVIKSEQIKSPSTVLQPSNQIAITETISETTSKYMTRDKTESNIERTQSKSTLFPSTLKTSTPVTISSETPTIMGYFPDENYYSRYN